MYDVQVVDAHTYYIVIYLYIHIHTYENSNCKRVGKFECGKALKSFRYVGDTRTKVWCNVSNPNPSKGRQLPIAFINERQKNKHPFTCLSYIHLNDLKLLVSQIK